MAEVVDRSITDKVATSTNLSALRTNQNRVIPRTLFQTTIKLIKSCL